MQSLTDFPTKTVLKHIAMKKSPGFLFVFKKVLACAKVGHLVAGIRLYVEENDI